MLTRSTISRWVKSISDWNVLLLCHVSIQGSVNSTAFNRPVLLIGREHMNRAVDGDVVVIEVLPESEWKAPADEVIDQDGRYSARQYSLSADPSFVSCFEG